MKRLLDEPSLSSAFRFGWNALAGMLAEHYWIYALIAAAGVVFAEFFSSASNYRFGDLESIAIFPALAAAVRFARPDFRMDWPIVARIIGIWALIVGIAAAVFIPLALLARAFPAVALLVFLLAPFVIWILGKLALAVPYYALQDERERGIRSAIAESMDVVAGGLWWTILGLTICIGLVCTLIPAFLAGAVMHSAQEAPSIAVIVAAIIYYAGAIPAVVWTQASLVAIATSARPQYLAPNEIAQQST